MSDEKVCSVKLCDGGIWECRREELEAENARLRAEVEKFRDALEQIAYPINDRSGGVHIAREALKQ